MRILALALVLACHREVRQETHIQEREATKTAKADDESGVETKTWAPIDSDIKTTHEDNAVIVAEPDGTVEVVPVVKNRLLVLKPGAKVVGVVPLKSTVRDEVKHVGPRVDERTWAKKSAETSETDKKLVADSKVSEKTDVGPGWKFYGFLALAASAVLAAAYGYLKFIKKVVWL